MSIGELRTALYKGDLVKLPGLLVIYGLNTPQNELGCRFNTVKGTYGFLGKEKQWIWDKIGQGTYDNGYWHYNQYDDIYLFSYDDPWAAEIEMIKEKVKRSLHDKIKYEPPVVNRPACFPWTPLQYACACGNLKTVKFLLEQGAKKKHKDEAGKTAEKIALHVKQYEVVNLFH